MDIKNQIEEIVDKVKNDDKIAEKFQKEPEKTIEEIAGVDIPDGMLDKVVSGVQAKLGADKLSGALGSLKGLF